MRDNPLQFAVVREDPAVELSILRTINPHSVLLIGSGGCSALSLQYYFPETHFTLIEPNPAQIELIQRKMESLKRLPPGKRHEAFNIEHSEDDNADRQLGLSNAGNFESLFRGLREFIFDFILPREEMRKLFEPQHSQLLASVNEFLFTNKYWPVAFQLFFSDPILNTMFGPDATQYAAAGSYPSYFQRLIEKGLTRKDAIDNYFLHHVLLGHYIDRPQALPVFLNHDAPTFHFQFVPKVMNEVDDLERYDFVGLSNICDWMPPEEVQQLTSQLTQSMKPSSVLLYRQLNNDVNLEKMLEPAFVFDSHRNTELLSRDRSLFYSSIHVGVRR